MPATTLRNLAKAYAKQSMEHKAYRDARAKFINGVISGDLQLPVNNYPPLIKPKPDESQEITLQKAKVRNSDQDNDKDTGDITQIVTPEMDDTPQGIPRVNSPQQADEKQGNLGIIIGVAVIVITAIVLAVVLFSNDSIEGEVVEQVVVAPPAVEDIPEPVATGENAAQELISAFLSNRNWSTTSLDAFIIEWELLPQDQRQAAMGSMELSQLTNEISKQLLEERALAGIGDNPMAEEKQQQLLEFASRIGIQDSRLR